MTDYTMQGGILYIQGRILIPPTSSSLILQILKQYHDAPLAGHFGVTRTQALIQKYFLWPVSVCPVRHFGRDRGYLY